MAESSPLCDLFAKGPVTEFIKESLSGNAKKQKRVFDGRFQEMVEDLRRKEQINRRTHDDILCHFRWGLNK